MILNVKTKTAYFFEDLDDFIRLGGLGHGGDVQDDPLGHAGAGGDDGAGEAEVAEVLQLGGGGGHLYKPQCGQWTAGLSRSVSVCSDIWGINDPNDH